MSAIKLEEFAHEIVPGVGARVVRDEDIATIRTESFENGIREGARAASEAFARTHSEMVARIHEVIADAYFSREAARTAAVVSLHSLVTTLVETLAPALCRAGLSGEIADTVRRAVLESPDDTLCIFVPPESVAEIGELFADASTIEVAADAALSTAQARVEWQNGFDSVDLAACAGQCIDAVHKYFSEYQTPINPEAKNAG